MEKLILPEFPVTKLAYTKIINNFFGIFYSNIKCKRGGIIRILDTCDFANICYMRKRYDDDFWCSALQRKIGMNKAYPDKI